MSAVEYAITGFVNLFTYLALTRATGDEISWLSALFLFSVSMVLEAISIWKDKERSHSKIVLICFFVLGAIGTLGILLSLTGQSNYINVTIRCNNPCRIFLSSYADSLLYIPELHITNIVLVCGLVVTLIPLILFTRILINQAFRKRQYSLKLGFYEK